jgi:hypothetical protein
MPVWGAILDSFRESQNPGQLELAGYEGLEWLLRLALDPKTARRYAGPALAMVDALGADYRSRLMDFGRVGLLAVGEWRSVRTMAEKRVREELNLPEADDPLAPPPTLRRYGVAELVAMDLELHWLIESVLARPTYGQIAGELKTLKTYLALCLIVALASGQPFLGRWAVPEAMPVELLVGEGGRIPITRRLVAVCRAYGVELRDLPIGVYPDEVAPADSPKFQATLDAILERQPGLVVLDPWYTYHGANANAANLHEEGALLSSVSAPCVAAGASLLIVNHFNQTGSGGGLRRITMAGSGEWVDSWFLTSHRDQPDVERGLFRLRLDIGSRQWGGSQWDLDFNLGALDEQTGAHDGDLTWSVRPAGQGGMDEVRERILAAVADEPGELSKEDAAKVAGGRRTDARRLVDQLVETGWLDNRLV